MRIAPLKYQRPPEVPKSVRRARTAMYGQIWYLVLLVAIPLFFRWIFTEAGVEPEAPGEATVLSDLTAVVLSIVAVLSVVTLIGIIVVARKLKTMRPRIRTWALVVEFVWGGLGAIEVMARNWTSIGSIAIAGYAIAQLMSDEAKTGFANSAATPPRESDGGASAER